MVRTVPATMDFHIPSSEIVAERIANSYYGTVKFSDWYYDQFSLSDNTTKIIALRILVDNLTDYDILIQIEVIKEILDYALQNVFSFPSTKIFLIKVLHNNTYSILGQNAPLPTNVNISSLLNPGEKNLTISDTPFLVTTDALIDDNNHIDQTLGQLFKAYNPITDLRLIIFLNKSQT